MLRIVGALCILCGAVSLGLGAVGRLRERVTTLQVLRDSLAFLEEELSFRLTPLPRLLEQLSGRGDGAASAFFHRCLTALRRGNAPSFRDCWREALTGFAGLGEEERQVLLGLGDTLGRYDGDAQLQAIRQANARLERLLEEAREDRGRLSRVYTALSVAAGLGAVIVLM